MKEIVVIGGGTGSSTVLKGIKNSGENLYGIVPMGDSGGSTGRLRDEFGVQSSGEIRQRLIALASDDETVQYLVDLLGYRFLGGKELKGHNLGNLIICGFAEMYGSQEKAFEVMSKLLKVKGEIVPSTFDRLDLVAEYADGSKTVGEHNIDEPEEDKRIVRLYIDSPVKVNPRAVEVIENADYIIFSMGDLYTSVLHSVVVPGIAEAISASKAKKIYICNLMTSFGETSGMNLSDHIREIEKYSKSNIDTVLFNSREIPKEILEEHIKINQTPVEPELDKELSKRVKVIKTDLLSEQIYNKSSSDILQRSMLRHDSAKLAEAILKL